MYVDGIDMEVFDKVVCTKYILRKDLLKYLVVLKMVFRQLMLKFLSWLSFDTAQKW